MINLADCIALCATYTVHRRNANKPLTRANWAALFPHVTLAQWAAYVKAEPTTMAQEIERENKAALQVEKAHGNTLA